MNRVYERRWLRFAKGGKMKYIGHLDLLRVFQSAIRRAKLPIAYSMGFNPHQRLSFALPLPVGMDSVCEYTELLFEKNDLPQEAQLQSLDEHFPEGLRLLSIHNIPEKAPRPAAAVTAADYRLSFPGSEKAGSHIAALMDTSNITVLKKSKSGEKETDIRPDIYALGSDLDALTMRLSAGSARNLNPMLLAEKIFEMMAINPPAHDVTIVRRELYGSKDWRLVPLHEIV